MSPLPKKKRGRVVESKFVPFREGLVKDQLLAIGSLLFPAYVITTLIVAAWMSFRVDADARIPDAFLPAVVALLVFTFLSVAGLWFFIVFDIVHIAMNPRLSGDAKAGWICAIWFLHVFSVPVYRCKTPAAPHVKPSGRTGRDR